MKKEELKKIKRKAELHDRMAIIFFLVSAYISLNTFGVSSLHYFFGICFLISGLYGLLRMHEKRRFIFRV